MSTSNIESVIEALGQPFPVSDIEWKPGALNRERTKALALAYVDSRAYIQRLNLVAPDWEDRYVVTTLPDRIIVVCSLTIGGITRTGDGEALLFHQDRNGDTQPEANPLTTASAQAFKRACVKFSLGAYLYSLPQTWCDYDDKSRRITQAPKLPEWALCPAESESWAKVRAENDAALAAARTQAEAERQAKAEAAERLNQAATARVAAEHPQLTAEDQDLSIPADQPGMVEDPAHAKVHFGKNQGKTLGELLQTEDGRSWVEWLVEKFTPRDSQGTALQRSAKVLLMMRQRA